MEVVPGQIPRRSGSLRNRYVTTVPVYSLMPRLETLELHLKHLKDATNGDSILFAPSFVEPDAYWTSAEKALFFRSIARHSRWRPDLIAEDLGCTKSISDIWAYIQLLAESSATHSPLTTSDNLPPSAREMSDEWIAQEEVLANEVISNEAQWSRYINLQARRDSVLALKKSLNASPSKASEDLKYQKKALKRTSRRLEFLSKLNQRSLGNMDSQLQNSDNGYCQQGISNSEKNAFSPEKNDHSLPDRSSSLLNISDTEAPNLSPASRRRLQKRLWTRRKRCIESGVSPSEASMFLGKLKRGRKPSVNGRLARKYSSEQNIDDVQVTDEEKSDQKQNVLGQYDITRTLLVADGLDIFHLRKFAVLSRSAPILFRQVLSRSPSLPFFRWIFDSRQSRSADETTIAYDILCYLRSSLTHFLTLVIGKTIALRRADIRQRRIDEGRSDIDEVCFLPIGPESYQSNQVT